VLARFDRGALIGVDPDIDPGFRITPVPAITVVAAVAMIVIFAAAAMAGKNATGGRQEGEDAY
jgi:hypothetical protein